MPSTKLSPEIVNLLLPILKSEKEAQYFYEAARTWAMQTEYEGAVRQFKCFSHYHKHNCKMIMNIFAEWETPITFPAIAGPANGAGQGLPFMLNEALTVEGKLIDLYNAACITIMNIDLNVHKHFDEARCKAQKWWEEMREYNEKLQLFNTALKLDLVYFDRKILRW